MVFKPSNRFVFVIANVVLALVSCQAPESLTNYPLWSAQLDSLLDSQHQNHYFNGTVTIGNRKGIQYSFAKGIANRTWNTAIDSQTIFDMASVNKSFQAGLVLKAVEEGRLELSDKLIKFFPELSFDSNITIHHLLSNTSGLPDYDAVSDELKADGFMLLKRQHYTPKAYASFIAQQSPIGQPGEQFYYSNFGYHLLALILERVYGQDFPSLLREKICIPFGLNHTFAETDNRAIHHGVAEGYQFNEGDSSFFRNNYIDLSIGRRIFSTSADLVRWSQLLMKGNFISKESYKLMTTNHLKGISEHISYGYGFVVFDGGDYKMGTLGIDLPYIIHGGATEGYKSMLVNVSDGEIIIAMQCNVGNQTNEIELTKSILNIILK